MAKPLEDLGHCVALTRPLQIKRYEPNRVPDPGQCVDCLIIINDRSDGTPRGRLALSNGASWDHVAWVDESRPAAVGQPLPAQIDLTPLVREAVAAMMPTLQPSVKVIAPPQDMRGDLAPLAAAMLEMSEHVNRVMRDNADLMARVEYLERHALARVDLKEAAA